MSRRRRPAPTNEESGSFDQQPPEPPSRRIRRNASMEEPEQAVRADREMRYVVGAMDHIDGHLSDILDDVRMIKQDVQELRASLAAILQALSDIHDQLGRNSNHHARDGAGSDDSSITSL